MEHNFERTFTRLRVWIDDLPGEAGDGFAIEWAGRLWEPSSYALVGARHPRAPRAALPTGEFHASLAGGQDRVRFGLDELYAETITTDLARSGLEPAVVAHSDLRSSILAFQRACLVLTTIAADPTIVDRPADLWAAWDHAQSLEPPPHKVTHILPASLDPALRPAPMLERIRRAVARFRRRTSPPDRDGQ